MWRSRWQSLKLFTAGQYNDLPGMRFPAERDTYPGKDDVADFLRDYVDRFELPVRLNTAVTRLSKDDGRRYDAETTRCPRGNHMLPRASCSAGSGRRSQGRREGACRTIGTYTGV